MANATTDTSNTILSDQKNCVDVKEYLKNEETQDISFTLSGQESAVDIYKAIDEQSGEVVIVITYEGERQPTINVDSSKRIVWISRNLPMSCFQEVEQWNRFLKSQACVDLILLFNMSQELIDIISGRSDVVAIYPSTKVVVIEEQDFVIGVFRVIVKAVGYIPIGENPIPKNVKIGESIIDIEVQQGCIEYCCIKSGDGVAFEKDSSGYGTIGGVAIQKEKYYAVTNEHVINRSFNNTHWGTTNGASYLCSPSKGWNKLQLLKNLNQPIFNENGEFIDNVNSVLIECISNIKSAERVYKAMTKVSNEFKTCENNEISVKDVAKFAEYGQYRIGKNIVRLEWDVSTSQGIISGDVALIEFEDKEHIAGQCVKVETFGLNKVMAAWKNNEIIRISKIGASSQCTSGVLARPCHTKSPTRARESHLQNSNEKNRILQNQIIIHGHQFGRKGDSGSSVLYYNDDKGCSELVGIFTGSIGDSLYLCSPAEILSENSFDFALLDDF